MEKKFRRSDSFVSFEVDSVCLPWMCASFTGRKELWLIFCVPLYCLITKIVSSFVTILVNGWTQRIQRNIILSRCHVIIPIIFILIHNNCVAAQYIDSRTWLWSVCSDRKLKQAASSWSSAEPKVAWNTPNPIGWTIQTENRRTET